MTPPTESCDCAVIGGGPGGLTAAIYLARFNRNVLVFDAGKPRACWSPWNRNYPGFPEGISGAELVARFKQQAEEFRVRILPEWVTCLTHPGPNFCLQTDQRAVEARTVILATGAEDRWPDIPNLESFKGKRIRTCPICDAYEGNGRRVGLMGSGDRIAREALYLRQFTDDLTLFTIGLREEQPIAAPLLVRVEGEGIILREAPLLRLVPYQEEGVRVCLADGTEVEVDMLFTGLGCCVKSELALALGAEADEQGYLVTDRWQQTNVPGLYAVGDVTTSINQVTVAVGQAALAATAVHNSLLDF